MKKLVVSLIAAALMGMGLVGVSTSGASAAPYPGTVEVAPAAPKAKAKANKKAKISLAATGNVVPTGVAKVVCKGTKGPAKGKKVKGKKKALNAKGIAKTGKLTKGKWKCTVKFTGTGVFKSSKSKVTVKVK